jgi:hypothetical protein
MALPAAAEPAIGNSTANSGVLSLRQPLTRLYFGVRAGLSAPCSRASGGDDVVDHQPAQITLKQPDTAAGRQHRRTRALELAVRLEPANASTIPTPSRHRARADPRKIPRTAVQNSVTTVPPALQSPVEPAKTSGRKPPTAPRPRPAQRHRSTSSNTPNPPRRAW